MREGGWEGGWMETKTFVPAGLAHNITSQHIYHIPCSSLQQQSAGDAGQTTPRRSVYARLKALEQGEGEATLGRCRLAPASGPTTGDGRVYAGGGPGVVLGGVGDALLAAVFLSDVEG